MGFQKRRFWLFCWFRGATFERTEEEEGESAAGVLAGHEGVHALPPVVAALLPRPLLRFRDDLALQVDQQVAEFLEPGAVEVTALVRGLDRAACLCCGAARAAGAATSVGGHSYSVQSASEVLTIALSGGGALNASYRGERPS